MPTVVIANVSQVAQTRWIEVPMACSQADSLPTQCLVNWRFPAAKGRRVADHTQMWEVKVAIDGDDEFSLVDWQLLAGGLPAFSASPWVVPSTARLDLKVWVGGAWSHMVSPGPIGTVVWESPVCVVTRYQAVSRGWQLTYLTTQWSGQDVVDVVGYVVYSTPESPAWALEGVKIGLSSGTWESGDGAPLALQFAVRNGWEVWKGDEATLLKDSKFPQGCAIPFRGVMLCQRATTPLGRLPISLAEQEDALGDTALTTARMAAINAAAGGPIIASPIWPQGEWLAFGRVADFDMADGRSEQFRALLQVPGSVWDVRPGANHGDHGGTGMQPPFGSTRSRVACGDPWEVYRTQYDADDYWLRSCHAREASGDRTTIVNRPGFQTWAGPVEPKMSPDRFGKGPAPYGWDRVGPRSVFMDDQHRGSNPLLALAALGDHLAMELLRDMLATDESRAMALREGDWFDGPRASGRLLQHWAKHFVIASQDDRARLLTIAKHELNTVVERIVDNNGWIEHKAPDARVLPNDRFIVPWNEALFTLGCFEMARALQRVGESPSDAHAFEAAAIDHGRKIVDEAFVTENGKLIPINGLRWLLNGERNPPAYYQLPRPGANTAALPDIDCLLGDKGWMPWYAGAITAASISTIDDGVTARATELITLHRDNTDEWWAVR